MEREEVFEKVAEIICEVLDAEDLELTEETTANDVEDWDSLSHLSIVNEIETEFKIKFTLAAVQGSKNIGEFVDALMGHLAK